MKEAVAIIGMACHVPGATNYRAFWQGLRDGHVAYRSLSRDTGRREKASIQDPERFDAVRFGINEQEARIMDPQLRRFLMLVDDALLDAGYPKGEGLAQVGVVATQASNGCYHDYLTRLQAEGRIAPLPRLLENVNKGADFLATRTACLFDFHGPCFNLQSGCSSSLLAIIEAANLILAGRCETAVAGGMTITYPLNAGYHHESGSIYSASGQCRPFDEEADGTVPADGGGVVILKSFSRAMADGDVIYALVRGMGVNNDGGRKPSFAAPSVQGQFELLARVYQEAGICPSRLAFVECHATGTTVGDPIEVQALRRLRDATPPAGHSGGKTVLGSVKGNIGHLFWAAGVVSLIKSVLSLQHGCYPGTANFRRANPLLALAHGPFMVSANTVALDLVRQPYGAVSCFGVGGSNAHLLLQAIASPCSVAVTRPAADLTLFTLVPVEAARGKAERPFAPATVPASHIAALTDQVLCQMMIALYREVLAEEQVQADSNYFDLYGDSVTAIQLIADVQARLGLGLSQQDIYECPTPARLAQHLRRLATASTGEACDPVHVCRLNRYQTRFYLLEKLQRGPVSHYNVPVCLEIDPSFPLQAFTDRLQTVLRRLPAFCHSLVWVDGPWLEWRGPRPCLLETETIHLPAEMDADTALSRLFARRFDLEQGCAARLSTISHGQSGYLVLNFPHLLIDGTGLENLLRQIEREWDGQPPVPVSPVVEPEDSTREQQLRDYWQARLYGMRPTELTGDRHALSVLPPDRADELVLHWPEPLADKVFAACKQQQTTPYLLLYAAFNLLLARETGTSALLTGTTLSNRLGNTLGLVDCRINNLPLLVRVNPADPWHRIFQQTCQSFTEAMAHAELPLDAIVQAACMPMPYRILFMFQNQNRGYVLRLAGRVYREARYRYRPLYADLTFNFTQSAASLCLTVHFDPRRYSEQYLSGLLDRYCALTHVLAEQLSRGGDDACR